MVNQWRFQCALSEFARTLVRGYDVGEILYRFSDHVTEVLEINGSGVSVLDADGHLRFVTATNASVERVERIQETCGEGPCLEATRKESVLAVPDLEHACSRWSSYVPDALASGLRAVLAVPMQASEHTLGALNAYHSEPHEWTSEDVSAVQTLSDMATAFVLMAGQVEDSKTRAEQLQHALNSRVVVEQAKGVLAARHDEALAEAFERLRRYARPHHRTVHSVARAVLAGDLDL